MEREEISAQLGRQIKLYRHLGLRAVDINARRAHFAARIQDHLNHKGTAFGGSLYAIAVLAGYALILASLREAGFQTENIVIAKGEMEYLRPVTGDFEAVCEWGNARFSQVSDEMKSLKKSKFELQVQIFCESRVCARLTAAFVVRSE